MVDFTTIEYLKTGTQRQQEAYQDLMELRLFEKLWSYKPILTGTIPIDIDLPESDLDIICQCKDHVTFAAHLRELFGQEDNFDIVTSTPDEVLSTVAKFQTARFEIEIFGQDQLTLKQNAYRHMIAEYKILKVMGAEFKANIRKLKREGLKTEPAFAQLLGLTGNPYEALLKFEL